MPPWKICNAGDRYRGADASAEGVQRDLLPMIEGSSVQTKHGNVNTDFILFIASGAFHSCKPSDLLAELQVLPNGGVFRRALLSVGRATRGDSDGDGDSDRGSSRVRLERRLAWGGEEWRLYG